MFKENQIIENGIVKSINGNRVVLKIINQNPSKCKSCGVCIGVEKDSNFLELESFAHLKVGQQVTLQITQNSPYKSILFLLLTPIASLLTGSLIGEKIPFIFQHSQDMQMAFCGFVFFVLSVLAVSFYDKKLRNKKNTYRKILSVDNLIPG